MQNGLSLQTSRFVSRAGQPMCLEKIKRRTYHYIKSDQYCHSYLD